MTGEEAPHEIITRLATQRAQRTDDDLLA